MTRERVRESLPTWTISKEDFENGLLLDMEFVALIFELMTLYGLDKKLEFLSSYSNTGWKAGIIDWLKKMLGRKVT